MALLRSVRRIGCDFREKDSDVSPNRGNVKICGPAYQVFYGNSEMQEKIFSRT
jgi:hypothetical protein